MLRCRCRRGQRCTFGLATGGGRAFMINDTNAQPYYVFDLTSNAYLPNLPNAFTGTNGIFSGATAQQGPPSNKSGKGH